MENNLKEGFINHSGKISDRWALYINEWDKIFSPFRDCEINLLEIGVHNGGSLEIWAKYFTQAKHIVGCDNDEACLDLKYDDPRISVFIGDVNSDDLRDRIQAFVPEFDIIIDDGSHDSGDVIKAFAHYFTKLNVNGVYLIEDLHASYWPENKGGLFNPYSSMSFLKRLVDLVNFEHWQKKQSREKYLQPYEEHYGVSFQKFDFHQLHSIQFINSLCVIQKRPAEENALGKRMIVGSIELKPQNYHKLDGTSIHDMDKDLVDDTSLDIFSLIKQLDILESGVKEREDSIQLLKKEISEQEQIAHQLRVEINTREQSIQQLQGDLQVREDSIQNLSDEISKYKQIDQESRNLIFDQNRVLQGLYQDLKEQDLAIDQLQDQLAEDQQQISGYDQQIHILNQKVSRLENEALFYALSKSWRFTRPLRKLIGLFRGNRNV